MAEENDTEKEVKEEVQTKKSSLKFIILGVALLVLGAGGYFSWNLVMKGKVEEKTAKKSQSKSDQEGEKIVYPLESFIVNLMDKTGLGKRYLKATMVFEVDGNEESQKRLERYKPQLRDTILLLLSSQLLSEINTMEGKIELKQALLYKANQVIGEGIVHRVYFTEFVVQ